MTRMMISFSIRGAFELFINIAVLKMDISHLFALKSNELWREATATNCSSDEMHPVKEFGLFISGGRKQGSVPNSSSLNSCLSLVLDWLTYRDLHLIGTILLHDNSAYSLWFLNISCGENRQLLFLFDQQYYLQPPGCKRKRKSWQ